MDPSESWFDGGANFLSIRLFQVQEEEKSAEFSEHRAKKTHKFYVVFTVYEMSQRCARMRHVVTPLTKAWLFLIMPLRFFVVFFFALRYIRNLRHLIKNDLIKRFELSKYLAVTIYLRSSNLHA